PRAGRGLRSGYYHENEQLTLCATCTQAQVRAESPEEVPAALDRAFLAMTERRPGPVLFEVPVDVQRAETSCSWPVAPRQPEPLIPAPGELETLAKLL